MLPPATSRSMPSRAVIVPKRLIRPRASIIVSVKPSSPLVKVQSHPLYHFICVSVFALEVTELKGKLTSLNNRLTAQTAAREKAELDTLQKVPEGEFSDFLKRLGEKAPKQ
jgi:hypothetical protein